MAASLTNNSGSAVSSITVTGTPTVGTYSLAISGSATAGWLATLYTADGSVNRMQYVKPSTSNTTLLPGVTITFGATLTATDQATIVVRASTASFATYSLTTSYQDVSVTDAQAKVIIYKLRQGDSGTVRWADSGSPSAYATFSENMPLEIQVPENMDGPPTIYMRMESGTATLEVVVLK